MRKTLKLIFLVLSAILPQGIKRRVYRMFLGWEIADSSRIGLSLIGAQKVRLGQGAKIGHFNVIRNLRVLDLQSEAAIGQWNWCTAALPFQRQRAGLTDASQTGTLILGQHSALTSRHYVDCSGGVLIGAFTTVAGVRSTLLSHQIDMERSQQTVAQIEIGSYCFIGSDVRITPGSIVPDRCLIAMGSVVTGRLPEPGMLYAGVPAKPIKPVGDGEYFHRDRGYVSVSEP